MEVKINKLQMTKDLQKKNRAAVKVSFNVKKKNSGKPGLGPEEEIDKRLLRTITIYGSEAWKLRKGDRKYLEFRDIKLENNGED